MAGGIGPAGDDSVTVMLTREGKTTQRAIDIAKMYKTGDLSNNFEVENGDTIYVQRAPLFYIYGEVQRPGVFRLERGVTVMQALATGGGLTAKGTQRGLRVQRRDAQGKVVAIEPSLDELLRPDDVVYVKESIF